MAEWQPIETAKKDGKTIYGENWFTAERGLVHWNGEDWEEVDGLTNFPSGRTFEPSHWMPPPKKPPRPNPPATQRGSA